MSHAVLHSRLQWVEVSSRYAPDCRRVIRDERQTLGIALRSGDPNRIRAAAAEALRVAAMWGVEVRS